MRRLLSLDDPAPVSVHAGDPDSPFVLTVDHAGKTIPKMLGRLGVEECELDRHIAWDIGALGLAHRLAERLRAVCYSQRYSRLVIDCNRPVDVGSSIPTRSEDTDIPGNVGLTEEARRRRQEEIFWPYHRRIEAEIREREQSKREIVLVTVHSFTPVYRGVSRPMHAGILYHLRDRRLAEPLLELLRGEAGLVVGDNEPYSVSDDSDYGVLVYGERRGHLNVELEVRQDLLGSERGQEQWAERLASALRSAHQRLSKARL